MTLWEFHAILWRLLGCRVFEDLSAICGGIAWQVPW